MDNAIYDLASEPILPQTTIFIGNGFDLSLGLRTRYLDFFEHVDDQGKKDFWPVHSTIKDDDQLYKRLNGVIPNYDKNTTVDVKHYNWSDLEEELKEHAKRPSPQGIQYVLTYKNSFIADKEYFEEIKIGFTQYLINEVNEWSKSRCISAKDSEAYQLMYEVCVKAASDPYIITFNYTDIVDLLRKCDGNNSKKIKLDRDKICHVHGTLINEHIILGTDEDKAIPKEYDFLFKSWDDYYETHPVLYILRSSQIIIFFGLSFGAIDSVYFVDFFKSIIDGKFDIHRKHIVICTFNEDSMKEIYRHFFEMDISIMELKAHCDIRFLLTNPDDQQHKFKFDRDKLAHWLKDWNRI